MDDVKKYEMMQAMRRYGGSFVVNLAACFMSADADNFQRLLKAFPEYVKQYSEMAELDAAKEKEQ